MKKPGEKLALCAAALGVVIAGLAIALQSGTSRQRTGALAAFHETVPPALAKRLRPDEDEDILPASNPAQPSAGGESAELTIAAFEGFWPQLALQSVHGSLWREIERRKGKFQDDPYDASEIAKMQAFVARNQEFIAEIKQLAALGGPVADLDYSQGMAMQLPHLAKLREMARVLRIEAIVLAEEGDFAGAAENILLTMKLGDAVAEEPILISQTVRMAIHRTAIDTVRDALPPGKCPPEALGPLLAYAAQADHRDSFADSMSGQGVLGLVQFNWLREGGIDSSFGAGAGAGDGYLSQITSAIYTSPLGSPWVNMDEAAYAQTMARMADAGALPYHEARPVMAEIERDIQTLPAVRFVSRALLPMVVQAAQDQARHEANLDLMQLGLLVEQHHAEHGVYPESLNALVGGQPPLDPFTGDPYRYLPRADGFLLYSLGSNLVDDGGLDNYTRGDIVWRGMENRE